MTLTGTISILTFFSAVVSAITNYFYKSNCQKIYGINKSNFTFSDKFELLLISLGSIFLSSVLLEYLSEFILNSNSNLKKCIGIVLSLIALYFIIVFMYQLLDLYVFNIKKDKISKINRISAAIFAFVYYLILSTITGLKYIRCIYKISIAKDLATFNKFISCFLFVNAIGFAICIVSIVIFKPFKKKDRSWIKWAIKCLLKGTFGFICCISLFYTTVLFAASNAAKKVEYDLNKKNSINVDKSDDESEENWLTNRATEIKNFPLEYMTEYFKNPIRLYKDEFIEDYIRINGLNLEDDKIEKFNLRKNESSIYFNKKEEELKERGIYDEAIEIVRVSYFVNLFNENDDTILFSCTGLFICLFIIPLLLVYRFDPKRKKEYEIIEDKYAVITKKDGYVIALGCFIEDNNEKRNLFIEKSNKYKIFKFDLDQKIENIKFNSVEIIEKQNEEEFIKGEYSNSYNTNNGKNFNVEIRDINIETIEINNEASDK